MEIRHWSRKNSSFWSFADIGIGICSSENGIVMLRENRFDGGCEIIHRLHRSGIINERARNLMGKSSGMKD